MVEIPFQSGIEVFFFFVLSHQHFAVRYVPMPHFNQMINYIFDRKWTEMRVQTNDRIWITAPKRKQGVGISMYKQEISFGWSDGFWLVSSDKIRKLCWPNRIKLAHTFDRFLFGMFFFLFSRRLMTLPPIGRFIGPVAESEWTELTVQPFFFRQFDCNLVDHFRSSR